MGLPLASGVDRDGPFRTGDPDAAIWDWLRSGAPMGLSRPIVPGTHFPRVEVDQSYSVDVLDRRSPFVSNHPSFDEVPSTPASTQDAAPACVRSPAWTCLKPKS